MRVKTLKNLYDKTFVTFPFSGLWERAFGTPETTGMWLVFGAEKNGKTWFSLKLAEYLAGFDRTLYVSAEEGTKLTFVNACRRAGLDVKKCTSLHFENYTPIEELDKRLTSRKAPRIVFLDNLTVYDDELRAAEMTALLRKHSDKLFVFIAHEEKGAPYLAAGKRAKKYAEIIIQVKGLTAFISGRCPGGQISIDETKAALYWGQPTTEN